jgi:Ser/Thr protein kinase RdoA (MazF antagonist)
MSRAALAARILDFARSNEGRLAAGTEGASLVHGDFNSPNILVRHDAGARGRPGRHRD